MEISQTLDHVFNFLEDANGWLKKVENLNFLEEDREMAHVQSITYKEKINKYFDKHERSRDFHVGDPYLKKGQWP